VVGAGSQGGLRGHLLALRVSVDSQAWVQYDTGDIKLALYNRRDRNAVELGEDIVRLDLVVHIFAGAVGILSGYVALSVAKGAGLHRRSGMVFVYAMTTMALIGTTIAFARDVAPWANGPVGLLTAYLVGTGLTTVRRPPTIAAARLRPDALVVAVTVTLFTLGVPVLASPTGKLHGMPALPSSSSRGSGCWRPSAICELIRAGAFKPFVAHRASPSICGACTALLIAAFSFFLGQASHPEADSVVPLLLIPPLIVLGRCCSGSGGCDSAAVAGDRGARRTTLFMTAIAGARTNTDNMSLSRSQARQTALLYLLMGLPGH
jgi:uncharacterized membrane protein